VRLAQAGTSVGTLRIDVVGFTSARGHGEVKLFRKGENLHGKPFRHVRATPSAGKSSFVFSELPYGNYAVVVFHDENDNGAIDHNILGLPAEALGFSGGFSLGLFSGMPTFEKLKFAFAVPARTLQIRVK